jgi:hypothetical protein
MTTEDYRTEMAEWLTSWATRLENAYNAGIDDDGWPRFQKAINHFDATGQLTPGAIEYMTNRDKNLGLGKLQNYNTHRGLHRKLGTIKPVPVEAIILSGLVDWSIGGAKTTDFARRLETHTRDWCYNPRSHCWQGTAARNTVAAIFA